MNLKHFIGTVLAAFVIASALYVGWFGFQFFKKCEHGTNLGHLGEMVEGITHYRKDKGAFPKKIEDLTPEYLLKIPELKLVGYGHGYSCEVESYEFLYDDGKGDPKKLKDTGHWIYDPRTGILGIDCTHGCYVGIPYYEIGDAYNVQRRKGNHS